MAFTNTTSIKSINDYLALLNENHTSDVYHIFPSVVAFKSKKEKDTAVGIAADPADYQACHTVGSACFQVSQNRIWWVESFIGNVAGEGGSANADNDWHASLVILRADKTCIIYDPNFTASDSPRRLNNIKGQQVTKALLNYLTTQKGKKPTTIFYTGGGNRDEALCRPMVQSWLNSLVENAFVVDTAGMEEIKL